MAEGGMSNATKGKMTCSIHIARGDDQTTVTLGVGPQNQ
jgi:hypothetical protein